VASFPDAVTSRGLKHLRQLQCMVEQGDRALQLYFVQRADCSVFRPADDIDPAYGRELRKAAAAGVGILALKTQVRLTGITITGSLPVEL
jgi:sugar fermentation stimulation protein A